MDGNLWVFFAIIAWVVCAAWLSRFIALDMDRRGKAGWPYGLTTFILPPVGLLLWLIDRDRSATHTEWRPEIGSLGDALLFFLLLLTFPWGPVIFVLINLRARANKKYERGEGSV